MKLALVTDAWEPQVNGVVTTLVELVREMERAGHTVVVIHPGLFRCRPCPGYRGIDLALWPARRLRKLLDAAQPDAIHLATEGPLGWSARRYCLRRGLQFTSAYHTRFPEMLKAAMGLPLWLGYAIVRQFHRPSSGVLVPTAGVIRLLDARGFGHLRSWTHGVDMGLFRYADKPRRDTVLADAVRPISLYVGRVSYEKNIEAFLQLDLPGTKVVCGVGPLEESLKARFPNARWLGVLPRTELAEIYAAADVFVMPSRFETFGLVMLEAMACGTPVAAFRVDGPLEVLGQPAQGGVLADDLRQAWFAAMGVERCMARARASDFSWEHAARQFTAHLVAKQSGSRAGQGWDKPVIVTKP